MDAWRLQLVLGKHIGAQRKNLHSTQQRPQVLQRQKRRNFLKMPIHFNGTTIVLSVFKKVVVIPLKHIVYSQMETLLALWDVVDSYERDTRSVRDLPTNLHGHLFVKVSHRYPTG